MKSHNFSCQIAQIRCELNAKRHSSPNKIIQKKPTQFILNICHKIHRNLTSSPTYIRFVIKYYNKKALLLLYIKYP